MNGLRNGTGTFFYANGSTYVGEWQDNVKSGYGVVTYHDGSVFEGRFELDRMVGVDERVAYPGGFTVWCVVAWLCRVQTDVTMRGAAARVSEDPSNTQQRLRIEDICNSPTVRPPFRGCLSVVCHGTIAVLQTAKREVQEVANVLLKWNSFVRC